MGIFDILIPLVIGLLLVASPDVFTRATGSALDGARRKLRRTGFFLIGCAAIYSVPKLAEPSFGFGGNSVKPQIEMHRQGAVTPGEQGWYLGESTHGSFSVLLPIPFNDFTTTISDSKIGAVKAYAVGALSAEGVKFAATEIAFLPGMTPPDLDKMLQDLSKNGHVSDVVRASYLGWPSISFSIDRADSGGDGRYIRTSSSLILLVLEYPAAQRYSAVHLKSRFLDSLKFKKPATSGQGPTTGMFHGSGVGRDGRHEVFDLANGLP